MIKFLFFLSFLLMVSYAEAQIRGEARFQAGGEYRYYSEYFGVNFGAEYFIANRFSLAPNYTIMFTEDNYKSSNLNIDARYYFTEGVLQWYGIAGFANIWSKFSYSSVEYRSNYAGANLGLGGVLKFSDRWAFNPELKAQLPFDGGREFILKLGLVYLLN